MSPKSSAAAKNKGPRPVAQNRKARHDYDILETFEAGIVLAGSEVKSLRDGKVQLRDSFARVQDGEVWMYGVHVAPYEFEIGRASCRERVWMSGVGRVVDKRS